MSIFDVNAFLQCGGNTMHVCKACSAPVRFKPRNVLNLSYYLIIRYVKLDPNQCYVSHKAKVAFLESKVF